MFIVVAYDVTQDRRRRRLHQLLKGYGTPVQYSVFECHLTQSQLQALQGLVKQTIDPKRDTVRYYRLCQRCQRTIEAINGVKTRVEQTVII